MLSGGEAESKSTNAHRWIDLVMRVLGVFNDWFKFLIFSLKWKKNYQLRVKVRQEFLHL